MGKAPYQELLDKKEFIPEELLAYLMSVVLNDKPNDDVSMFYDHHHEFFRIEDHFPGLTLSTTNRDYFYLNYRTSLPTIDCERLLKGLEAVYILRKYFLADIQLEIEQKKPFYFIWDTEYAIENNLLDKCPSVLDKKTLSHLIPEFKKSLEDYGHPMDVYYETSDQEKRAIQFGMITKIANLKNLKKLSKSFLIQYGKLYKNAMLSSLVKNFGNNETITVLSPIIQHNLRLNELIKLNLNKETKRLDTYLADLSESRATLIPIGVKPDEELNDKLSSNNSKQILHEPFDHNLPVAKYLETLLVLWIDKKIEIDSVNLLPPAFWMDSVLNNGRKKLYSWNMLLKIKYMKQTLILDERDHSSTFSYGLIEKDIAFTYTEFVAIKKIYEAENHMMSIFDIKKFCSAIKTIQFIREKLEMYIDDPHQWLVTIYMYGKDKVNCFQINLKYMDIKFIQATK